MGNTLKKINESNAAKDHPHIHGEYGSSSLALDAIDRITPTYMGNTTPVPEGFYAKEDHPHIHGEYLRTAKWITVYKGSPPHTWGIRGFGLLMFPISRITPTYMGNTGMRLGEIMALKDHPHIHGEYSSQAVKYA